MGKSYRLRQAEDAAVKKEICKLVNTRQQLWDLLDGVRALANVALSRGDMEALDREASEIIRLQPAAPEGYALRALSNVNRKRFSAAESARQATSEDL